ncbi:hypothetical protein JOD43_004492 [Pullulanibacillus pueri]|uniref:Uncharacterized protein n=1 Tax=Pullulanibacillus pueri TaxID=1437324 RepID=A0A8J3ENV0_9BACL|nr:hypothetical protein [Pullulanibacillus pueri]MBM7684270.1 hypothetical protein [Pullulanibacillus pueri]GGH89152.1 hypothetical protein GCM10007096_43090 [Pullulanibacillus pueri]
MLKKCLALLSALSVVLLFVMGTSYAKTVTSGDMFKAFQKQYSDENYDYKKGSLKITDVQTINLNQPITVKNGDKEVTVNQVQIGVAHFKTVRDYIFFKDWKEYAYYAPEQNLILTEGDVTGVSQIKDFEKQHESKVSLELGPIVGLCLLVIIIPLLFAYIWLRFKYNSLDFKLQNGMLEENNRLR